VIVCGSIVTVHVIFLYFLSCGIRFCLLLPAALSYVCIKNTRTLCETCIRLTLICDDLLNVYFIYYSVFGNDKCDTSNMRNV
jgi:hypothetical protein